MKILKQGILNIEWPKVLICDGCESEIQINEKDVILPYDERECSHIFCPVCHKCICLYRATFIPKLTPKTW